MYYILHTGTTALQRWGKHEVPGCSQSYEGTIKLYCPCWLPRTTLQPIPGSCPGVAVECRSPSGSSALLPTQRPGWPLDLAYCLPCLRLPKNPDTSNGLCTPWPAPLGYNWVPLGSQLHISSRATLLTALPWCSIVSALSLFGHIFNKQHASHRVFPNVWRYGRK